MENKELLLKLLKKLESGEIKLFFANDGHHLMANLMIDNEVSSEIVLGGHCLNDKEIRTVDLTQYNSRTNEEFKDNFYREKGVKCWSQNCLNKILQVEGDHRKLKIPCSESHTRLICLECYKVKYMS